MPANIGDHDVLPPRRRPGSGLDAARVDGVLAGDEYADAVDADIAQARAYGATGVPFFVIDQKYGISGAQPAEMFGQALEQAWADAHPQLERARGRRRGGVRPGRLRDLTLALWLGKPKPRA